MIESAHDAIFFKDLESRYIVANEKTLEAFGLPKEDVIGKNDYELMPDQKEAQKNVSDDQIVFKSGKSTEIYKHMTGAGGKEYWFQAIKVPQFDNDGKVIGLVGIARDITEKKRAEEEKHKLEAQLQQARKMESIGTLAGGIAHDFNNILEVILANTEFALGDIPKSNPLYTNLEEIKNASMNAAGIVRQLLNFSHKNNQELKPTDAINVIKDAIKFLRSAIPSTIEINTNFKTQEVTILTDPVHINQVLMNLGSNASQAMDETGGILEINVEKETLKEDSAKIYPDIDKGDYVKITVSDTGPGIEPDIIERIFDPYFTTKELGEGSGMGLAVVHSIVKNHNGAITVDSQPGKGATFTILFPVINVRPALETKSPDELPLGSESILFVDDEISIANITQKILKRFGYRVITSLNPLEALKLFASKPHDFDLVITDMRMPQMNGVELSEKLKEIRPNIPVILFTGHSSLIDEEKAKKLGISACVMKPIMVKNIARTIRNLLDNEERSS
jgi:PAS domain S-box-containing protein